MSAPSGFASPGGVVPDERHAYSARATLGRNQWSLSGDWSIGVVPPPPQRARQFRLRIAFTPVTFIS